MAPPIRVEGLASREAVDLVQALAVRGIVGKPLYAGEGYAVVVHDPHEDEQRLLAEVLHALEGWLADRRREPLEVRVGARTQTVRGGSDLASALRDEARARRGERRAL
jgi:hypothetical protein